LNNRIHHQGSFGVLLQVVAQDCHLVTDFVKLSTHAIAGAGQVGFGGAQDPLNPSQCRKFIGQHLLLLAR
jgi:hypothetical protein